MPKHKTNEEFIKEAIIKHNGKYSYKKTNYIKNNIKVCITCPIHGDFWQTPTNHLSGHGCPECMKDLLHNIKLKKLETYINEANKIHNNKYDYSISVYEGEYNSIDILCPIHGKFTISTAKNHLLGVGCPICSKEQIRLNKLKTTQEFVLDAIKIHRDKYCYDKVKYIGVFNEVEIICKKHGSFWQRPNDHLNGCGCPKCRYSKLEILISKLLDNNKIIYEYEKKFDFLPKLSSIDFYIESLNTAIECQGIQHFKPCNFFGGRESFNKVLETDLLKVKKCKDLGIKLLHYTNVEIPKDFNYYKIYTNTDELLKEILNSKN